MSHHAPASSTGIRRQIRACAASLRVALAGPREPMRRAARGGIEHRRGGAHGRGLRAHPVIAGCVLGLIASGCHPGRESRIEQVLRRAEAPREHVLELESPYLADSNRDVRALAVWAIGRAAGPGAAEAIAPLAHDPDPAVRVAVARALCGSLGAGDPASLVLLAADPDAATRRASLRCLSSWEKPPAGVFAHALDDGDREIRKIAMAALARHPDLSARAQLETILAGREADEQVAAVTALGALRDPRALPALERAASSRLSPTVRDAVEKAIIDLRAAGEEEKNKPAEGDPLPAASGGGDG